MCHSAATCEKFYQYRDHQLAITSKKTIKRLTKARHFTSEESSCILAEYPTTEDTTPSLAICEIICQKYKLLHVHCKMCELCEPCEQHVIIKCVKSV